MTTPATATLQEALLPEDQARADFYALLARLYASGPDAALLSSIASAPALQSESTDEESGETGNFVSTWNALREASAATCSEAAVQEYDELFVGVGKSEVNLHASHWIAGFMMEKPLADLRTTLARLGLGRREGVTLLEDHLAALCETMRILVSGHEDRLPASVAEQREFFQQHISPWVFRCCTAIRESPIAKYYRDVAQFTIYYLTIEQDSLLME